MTIKAWDYLKEFEAERDEILDGIEKVLRSGSLILGPSVKAFEQCFADFCGVRHGIGVNSGTDALFLALKAIGVGVDNEVITVSNTAIPTVAAIVSAGALPKFVDIEPDTYLMDVTQLEATITSRTKCILPVHLFGQCVKMDEVGRLASEHGLKILEDCAQAHGALRNGRRAGSMSTLSAFSFYPTKILGAFGDGGMVITDDEEIARKLTRLREYGMEDRYYSVEHGYNSRLDEIHAEILLRKMRRLETYIARRREIAARYDEALRDTGLLLPKTNPGNRHVYYLYVVRHPRRDAIIRKLAEQGIHVNIHYPWPIHMMKSYAHLSQSNYGLERTEKAAKEIFSLPIYPTLSNSEQDFVCDTLRNVLTDI
jgi:dTDP-3-amino-2,3,6-trideoxy-4-keto-D-glucose/dTDP-3-amino-3,4,6-trideoxy-alpha-D-glucose/dTDP-2,6-dideoxy-D-kanosamine transaminase